MALPTYFRRGINLVRRLFHKPVKPVDVQCSNSTLPGPDVSSHDSKLPTPSTASYHRPTNQQEDPTVSMFTLNTLPCVDILLLIDSGRCAMLRFYTTLSKRHFP
jgi:hypothetical protein